MSRIDDYYEARRTMVDGLTDELIGTDRDITLHEPPLNRFVTAILYPQDGDRAEERFVPEEDRPNPDSDSEGVDSGDVVDSPVSLSHVRYPSAFGLSFAVPAAASEILVDVTAAKYEQLDDGWHRVPIELVGLRIPLVSDRVEVAPTLALHVVVRPRRDGTQPITLALVNLAKTPAVGVRDGLAWYQVGLRVQCLEGFLDRPASPSTGLEDEDVASNRLLFRDARTLGVGHGCAVEWDDGICVTELRMSFIPTYNVARSETTVDGVPALPISVLAEGRGRSLLADLSTAYGSWIESRRDRVKDLAPELRATAHSHLDMALVAAGRISDGLDLLDSDPLAERAFCLMNRAMLDQRNKQEWIRNGLEPIEQYWRPFQIAFVLMNLRGITDPGHPERELADLLWFPTGGGKTEAYLGLIGYAIMLRRLRDPRHGGVSVIMRYTLRLLTLQQFERAAGLICALEVIRLNEMPDAEPVSLGLWVGQSATPNTVEAARTALRKLTRGESLATENPMQLTRCPWCGTTLSPDAYKTVTWPEEALVIRCPNSSCEFFTGLPTYVVDQDVYRVRPSLVIGTVDKFAMMAWRAEAQRIFSSDGAHPKPDLIVQDELHLISGPLGTMVGLYETAVDAACSENGRRPKLIASTATIRRARRQMQCVFARDSRQFPPPGLEADDSFFSTAADPATTGPRQYVGVLAQGVTHTYLLVRTFAALLQTGAELDAEDEVRDAYWTLVGYFNSLRVLGGAAMQVTDDVPAQMRVIARRHGTAEREVNDPKELTSRIPSSEIPARLNELTRAYGQHKDPLDVVLATNMISVGLDVDRLGLMAVMGQPQATAEYIQATSRVGRRYPGLVVVIYNSARSRDLSHYESFSTYHRALYRQVEPNSATPFSPRARDRGLHGCLVAYARSTEPILSSDGSAQMVADNPELLAGAVEGIVRRAGLVAPSEAQATREQVEDLIGSWGRAAGREALKFAGWRTPKGALLAQVETSLRDRGDDEPAAAAFPVGEPPWATLTSLRDVDATSSFFLISEKGW